jgi:uncharacterized membrane protein YhaH (DUF805 family)
MQDSAIIYYFAGLANYYVVIGVPVAKVLHRTGFSRWLSLLILIPLVNIVALWIFAFGAWRTEISLQERRERERDNWSDADKETFRLMNKPRG